MRLKDDEELHEDYLVRKMGFDPDDSDELSQATQILLTK